ncbi:unnamed protein product [Ceratitis capitata]|uniref:(Mediterranean fruit fly) hypothetical protein n=1 Tax=Ceratitis capitata TaxID=7213 RepID=A0A811UTH7_CERCA|nr:unnamed protein product [Ceratitis capitata]
MMSVFVESFREMQSNAFYERCYCSDMETFYVVKENYCLSGFLVNSRVVCSTQSPGVRARLSAAPFYSTTL